jgi:hypothetical protein
MSNPFSRQPVRGSETLLARGFGLYQRGVQLLNHLQPLDTWLCRRHVALGSAAGGGHNLSL